MSLRFALIALFCATAALVSADPRSVSGSDAGPVVAVVTGPQGGVVLWHGDTAVRAWSFPGPFACALILSGPLDKVEWDGDEAVVTPAGPDPLAAGRLALDHSKAPRIILAGSEGATEVIRSADGEETYDASTAATEE